MASPAKSRQRIVTDNIHGDIKLSDDEWRVVNTATFQRLRSLKQLGMGHLVYPNATHTRFAHSLGVFHIMCRVLGCLDHDELDDDKRAELRLAALLHDIGHYPYSHLMERIDWVTLTEEEIDSEDATEKTVSAEQPEYPDHETLGRHILVQQKDIREAIGGKDRAERIGILFSRQEAADQQLSKLIHSSLDMDRMDYLLRDARAAGVPFGEIDINYLLNSLRISPDGMLGVDIKALAAAEHFLLARAFMHRSVYYHKTTFGFEEACRQLLRRIRNSGRYEEDLPKDGAKVREICSGIGLHGFVDNYVDRVIFKAESDSDPMIRLLARTLIARRPPKLLVELSRMEARGDDYTSAAFFRLQCRNKLADLAEKHKVDVGQFLLCAPKPIKFEQRGSLLTKSEAEELESDEREELIMVFPRDADEPKSIVDMHGTMIKSLSNSVFDIQRLYFVDNEDNPMDVNQFEKMKNTVQSWTQT